MQDLYFGGHWLSEFGARLADAPQKEIAEYDFELIECAGRCGDVYLDNNRFKNVPLARKVKLANKRRIPTRQQIDKFVEWIAYLRGYQEFRDTQHPGSFTFAVLQNTSEIIRNLPRLYETTLNFNREPYWYTDEGQRVIELAQNADGVFEIEVDNPEPLDATPDYVIEVQPCTVQLVIGVNGTNILLPEITFDSEWTTLKVDNKSGQILLYDSDGIRRKPINSRFPNALPANQHSSIQVFSDSSAFNQFISSVKMFPNWRHL